MSPEGRNGQKIHTTTMNAHNDSHEIPVRPAEQTAYVADLPRSLSFTNDHDDVAFVLDHVGLNADDHDFHAVFVETENGDYTEVWGMCGSVPHNGRTVTRLV